MNQALYAHMNNKRKMKKKKKKNRDTGGADSSPALATLPVSTAESESWQGALFSS
jgi:hypothetical protein